MTSLEALQAAIDTMQKVIDVGPIVDRQGELPTPCAAFTVDLLVEHLLDTHNMLITAAGGSPIVSDDALGEHHRVIGEAATSQWAKRGTDGTIDLGGNELPAGFALSLHTLEIYVHAWDLATSLGRPFTPPDPLTDQMWSFANDFITDDVRGDTENAPYARPVEPDETHTKIERLIAHTGRDPRPPTG